MSGGGGDGGGGGGGYMFQSPESIGLGYAIAIALGLIVLLSSVLLASYLCCRRRRLLRRQDRAQEIPVHAAGGVIIPRIIFVAEEDDEEGGGGGVQGLDQAVINSYPKFPFSGAAKDRPNADAVCSICLCDYKDGEMLRMLPDCRHYFHLLCVDGWLRLNASCPICRTSPLPTPISTPLAEVVPLSQYPARTRR